MELSPLEAQRVVSALKRGVFPPVKVAYFTKGRTQEISSLKSTLGVAAAGGTGAAFYEGDYGYGKSHMLRSVQSIALDAGFAVAWITIDGRTHAFNHPTRYLHGFLENLRSPGLPTRGLSEAVGEWMRGPMRGKLLEFAGAAPWQIRVPLRHISENHEPREGNDLAGWLLEARDLQNKNGINYYEQFYERVELTGQLCCAAGLKGMVWLFDEVECISKFLVNRQSRFAAYSVLKQLVDSGRFHHSCFFFATTSEFRDRLETEYSPYARYEGAAEFVTGWLASKYPVHKLRKLSREDNSQLLRAVRDAHAIAYSWRAAEPVGDEFIERFLDSINGTVPTEREIVRGFVTILEVCEQNRPSNPTRDMFR
jgi:hypothetical protein